jgi:hypothetical protein
VGPTRELEPIHDSPEETWTAGDIGLKQGQRGLPGGSSLSQVVRGWWKDDTGGIAEKG